MASLGVDLGGSAFGIHERLVAFLTVAWPLVTAISTWWWAGHRVGSRRVRHVLAAVGLTAACALAGTSATAVAPATAQTRHYQASVALDPNLLRSSELVATTAFGDLRLEFQGVAPGIRTVPQVKANIADVLSRPGVSLASLRPGPEELSAAIRDVAVAVMVRFTLGALALVAAVLAGYAVLRRRRPPVALVVVALVGWLASTAVTGLAIYATYQPGRQETFTSTGVLGTLQRNQGILSDVETRATQVAPYLRNLIALSTALQQKYQAAPLQSDTSLRVLLVSDIHAGNQYDLMRTIVEEEGVDVVVDTGDLVNFGTVEEAEATGLFAGIESVGLPYLFVRGNHDANSATDTALLDRLARVPNVVLLEDGAGDYTEVSLHGIRIAGFNDPRWFGDSGTGSPAKQVPRARGVHGGVRRPPGPRPRRRPRAVGRAGPRRRSARQRSHALGRPRGQPRAGRHLHRGRPAQPLPRRHRRGGARRAAVGLRRADLRDRLPAGHAHPLPVPRRHRGAPGVRRRVPRQRPPRRRARRRPGPHLLTRRRAHDDDGPEGRRHRGIPLTPLPARILARDGEVTT